MNYRITFPDGTSSTFHGSGHVTHVVVARTGHSWAVESAFGQRVAAQVEAAWLQNGGVPHVAVVAADPAVEVGVR